MTLTRVTSTVWVVRLACAVSLTRWSMVMLDPRAINVTALHYMTYIPGPTRLLSAFVLAVNALALLGLRRRYSYLWFVPLQIVLAMSAASSIEAVVSSAFSDGVTRPRAFLLADQVPNIVIAVAFMFAAAYIIPERTRERT